MPLKMLEKLERFIEQNKLIKPGEKVLLAVSGGIDSMVMAQLILRSGIDAGIAHCNFSLRGNESDKDEELVRQYASQNNIPFFSIRFETKSYAKKNGISVQMAARDLRYAWFEEIRKENSFDSVAVAHNLNDNIETLLINLIRGTGISGMMGMRPVSNRIIRPLLFASRKDIVAYCEKHKINYREDRSNADTKYTRNKIRHLVIPVLKEINPSIETTLNETAERFTGINEIVTDYISTLREMVTEQKDEYISFNISLLEPYKHNKTVFFELFKPFGITDDQLNDLIKVTGGKTGGQIITGTHRIIKNRKELIVSGVNSTDETLYNINNIKELKNAPYLISARYIVLGEKNKIPTDPQTACIDSEIISFPLTIRKWKSGDHFYPFGMKQKKKLSDYFIDKKYSKLDKENRLILESDGKIVWIIGDRIDNRFRITRSTKKALILKAQDKGRRAQSTGHRAQP
jgi:tRNA(Ile)-lysidine synthase